MPSGIKAKVFNGYKWCTQCGIPKENTEKFFYYDSRKQGLMPRCKSCQCKNVIKRKMPELILKHAKAKQRRKVEALKPSYVAYVLSQEMKIPKEEILKNQDLIEVKTLLIKLNRLIKNGQRKEI